MSQSHPASFFAPPHPSERRTAQRHAWLRAQGLDFARAEAIPGDASGRRYWRLPAEGLILMDAAPPEDPLPFLRVQRRFLRLGLRVPRVHGAHLGQGFLLLEDLGSRDLKAALDAGEDPDTWIAQAMTIIIDLQAGSRRQNPRPPLPSFDAAHIGTELSLFRDWYLARHLGLVLGPETQTRLHSCFARLTVNALREPQTWVHRDFHARNLICLEDGELGVLDFQDAVRGPVSYDLASLLWDRYWDWGKQRRRDWAIRFHQAAQRRGLPLRGQGDFLRDLGRMGLQRNLKILGIFCRLAYRDGKEEYLQLLPRFRAYVWEAMKADPELRPYQADFAPWISSPCVP